MASGKSAVAARFRERGVPVIDADAISRAVAQPGSDAVALIAKEFGAEFVATDGTLERKKLSAHVFGDAASPPESVRTKVKRLNAIMHPRIAMEGARRTAELSERGEPLVCYEAALLVENGLQDAFRPLVVVAAPLAIQVARAAARDSLDEALVRARITAQLPLEEKIRVADIVVQNDGTLDDLRARADEVLADVCRRVGVDSSRYPV
jgi:dephospho-CoA kinase